MEADKPKVQTDIPPPVRDLSARYGRKSKPARPRHPQDVIPPISLKHPVFLLISSLGFAALYAELLFFAATYYHNRLDYAVNVALIAGVFGLNLVMFWASFVLPHRYYRSRYDEYSPIIFLISQWVLSIVMLIFSGFITLGAGILLVDGKLDAVGELLRSITLYSIVAIIMFHGLVIYVRYVRFLYEREMHESYKIVSFAGVMAVVFMIVTLYLLQFDLGRMGGGAPDQPWLSLHLSIRCVSLLALAFYVFLWHASVLADH